MWTFSFQISFRKKFCTSGSGQTENKQIHIFELCKLSALFCKMMKNLGPVFLRLIICMYINQFSNVRWGSKVSSSFNICNGVGQGKILAGFAYCYYCYDMFTQLENSGFGCRINDVFTGAFGYSGDDIFLAPSVLFLQELLKTAECYCNDHWLQFSTNQDPQKSKTKCIAWLKVDRQLPSLLLCWNTLPWVDKIKHLGNTIILRKTIWRLKMPIMCQRILR